MSAHTGTYNIIVSDKPTHKIVEIRSGDTLLHAFKIKRDCEDEVRGTLDKYSYLIAGPRHVNLFETESLQDMISHTWLYAEKKPYSDTEIVNALLEQLEKKEKHVSKCFKKKEEVSDLEILSRLRHTLKSNINKNISISLEGISEYKIDENIYTFDYAQIIARTRAIYSLGETVEMDLDDYIAMAGEEYLLKHLDGTSAIELRKIAFAAADSKSFKDSIFSLISSEKDGESDKERAASCAGTSRDGFMSMYFMGIEQPQIQISYLGVCSSYLGIKRKSKSWKDEVLTLEGSEFWDTVWYDLYAAHEKYLRDISGKIAGKIKEDIVRKKDIMSEYVQAIHPADNNLNEWFDRTIPSIAKELGVSTTTIRKDIASATAKIKSYYEERGLDKQDVMEMLLCA